MVRAFNIVKQDACSEYQPIIQYLEKYYIGEFLDIMAVVISQDRETITEIDSDQIDNVIDNLID